MPTNQLFYGDNLDVLHRYLKDESVDLIYLDPPFNSRQDYNVLFKEKDGTQSASQITAFEDTWEWNQEAMHAYEKLVERGGRVADVMRAFKLFLSRMVKLMTLGLIDILRLADFNPNLRTKLVRHQDHRYPVQELRRHDWLELYQSYQSKPKFHDVEQIVSFYGLSGTRAGFYGVYRVIGHRPASEGPTLPECD